MSDVTEFIHSITDETEPTFTPREMAKIKVERLAHDLSMLASDLVTARVDPRTRYFFDIDIERDVWTAKTKIDALLSELRASREAA